MTHNTIFSCATINIRSISGASKGDQVLNHLKSYCADVFFLEETHVYSTENIANLSKIWEDKSFWSPGSTNSCGTAILFKKNSNIFPLDLKQVFEGRVMSVLVSYGNLKINLVSIYVPNTLRERKLLIYMNFFSLVLNW